VCLCLRVYVRANSCILTFVVCVCVDVYVFACVNVPVLMDMYVRV